MIGKAMLGTAMALCVGGQAAAAVHQLRVYELHAPNKTAFHERFRDHAVRIMKRHGFSIVSMWEAAGPQKTEFVYLLEWPDEAAMKAAWDGFMADPEWAQIKKDTAAQHGRFVLSIEDRTLRLTDYSPAPNPPAAARPGR